MTRDQRCQGQGESRYINTHQNQQYMFFCFEYGLAPFPGYTDHKEPWSDWPYCGSVSCWSSMGQPLGYVFIHTIQISIKHKHACTEWSRSSFKGTKMGLENEWKWRGLIYALAMLGHPILLHLDNELQLFAQKEGNFLGQSFHPSSATETFSKKSNSFGVAPLFKALTRKQHQHECPGVLGQRRLRRSKKCVIEPQTGCSIRELLANWRTCDSLALTIYSDREFRSSAAVSLCYVFHGHSPVL